MEKFLEVSGEAGSQRDAYFGKVFGIAAVFRSGRLAAEPQLYGQIISNLLSFMSKKIYLRECSCDLLVNIIHTVPKDTFMSFLAPHLAVVLNGDLTTESIAITFACMRHVPRLSDFPSISKSSFFYKSADKVFRDSIAKLVPAFQRSAEDLPSLHCVWSGLWDVLAANPAISFTSVWTAFVEDGNLIRSRATDRRRPVWRGLDDTRPQGLGVPCCAGRASAAASRAGINF